MESITGFFSSITFDWKVFAIIGALIVVVFLMRMIPMALKSGIPFVQPAYVQKRLESDDDENLIVDVRSPEDFASGHIPGSINIPADQIPRRLAYIPEDELESLREVNIFMTCASGMRAMAAARFFKAKGFQRIGVVAGGCDVWKKQGLPLTGAERTEDETA